MSQYSNPPARSGDPGIPGGELSPGPRRYGLRANAREEVDAAFIYPRALGIKRRSVGIRKERETFEMHGTLSPSHPLRSSCLSVHFSCHTRSPISGHGLVCHLLSGKQS